MPVEARCVPDGAGYRCLVNVLDATSTSRYIVRVTRRDVDRWGHGRSVEELVADSFAFLLDREPRASILKEFDLSVIQRYFPEFSAVMTERG